MRGDAVDAYVLAAGATADSAERLAELVEAGTARAMLPLLGGYAMYVAVTAASARELGARLDAVGDVPGLTGERTYLAAAPADSAQVSAVAPAATTARIVRYPTYAAVSTFVGFALLLAKPGLQGSVYGSVTAVAGIAGAAMVSGADGDVLVEATGDSVQEVLAVLDRAAGVPGVMAVTTAVGEAALGAGLSR